MPKTVHPPFRVPIPLSETVRYQETTETRYPPWPAAAPLNTSISAPEPAYCHPNRAYDVYDPELAQFTAQSSMEHLCPQGGMPWGLQEPDLYTPADIRRRLIRPRSTVYPRNPAPPRPQTAKQWLTYMWQQVVLFWRLAY
jgi:hypothetical protein